ncbi:MAG: hypothetical protein V4736_03465, partial [Bdellovibrionota bacterium]
MFQKIIVFLIVTAVQVSHAADFKIPQKFQDKAFKKPFSSEIYFSKNSVHSKKYVNEKAAEWEACHQPKKSLVFSHYLRGSLQDFLAGGAFLTNLQEMDRKKLLESKVLRQPWSGDYWAYARGIIGARYRDEKFRRLADWKVRFDYVVANPLAAVVQQGSDSIQKLSPSEKYDLLVGDMDSTLTRGMWEEGKRYYDVNGDVEGWMGICHGWAPAAIMEERPTKS